MTRSQDQFNEYEQAIQFFLPTNTTKAKNAVKEPFLQNDCIRATDGSILISVPFDKIGKGFPFITQRDVIKDFPDIDGLLYLTEKYYTFQEEALREDIIKTIPEYVFIKNKRFKADHIKKLLGVAVLLESDTISMFHQHESWGFSQFQVKDARILICHTIGYSPKNTGSFRPVCVVEDQDIKTHDHFTTDTFNLNRNQQQAADDLRCAINGCVRAGLKFYINEKGMYVYNSQKFSGYSKKSGQNALIDYPKKDLNRKNKIELNFEYIKRVISKTYFHLKMNN